MRSSAISQRQQQRASKIQRLRQCRSYLRLYSYSDVKYYNRAGKYIYIYRRASGTTTKRDPSLASEASRHSRTYIARRDLGNATLNGSCVCLRDGYVTFFFLLFFPRIMCWLVKGRELRILKLSCGDKMFCFDFILYIFVES